MEEWIVKMTRLSVMAKLTCVSKDKTVDTFCKRLEIFCALFVEKRKTSEMVIGVFAD